MSLITAYRPRKLKDVVGNAATVKALGAMLKRERSEIPHAFLFAGPSGCGKTTLARIVAGMLDCRGMDFYEVDSADFRGIDSIREIRQKMTLAPLEGVGRAWLLDECHQLSKDAQSALLKALEDAPQHVYFLLATTDPDKLLSTIRNQRCSTFEVQPVDEDEMTDLLWSVVESEGKDVPEKVLKQIARDSNGSCRNALQILDKVIDLEDEEDMMEVAYQTAASVDQTIDLCRALMKRASWKDIAKIIKSLDKQDPEKIRRAARAYCSNTLLSGKDVAQAYIVLSWFDKLFYDKTDLIQACYEVVKDK